MLSIIYYHSDWKPRFYYWIIKRFYYWLQNTVVPSKLRETPSGNQNYVRLSNNHVFFPLWHPRSILPPIDTHGQLEVLSMVKCHPEKKLNKSDIHMIPRSAFSWSLLKLLLLHYFGFVCQLCGHSFFGVPGNCKYNKFSILNYVIKVSTSRLW